MNKRINVILSCLGIIGMIACTENGEKKKESSGSTPSNESATSTEAVILDFKSDGSKGVEPVTSIAAKNARQAVVVLYATGFCSKQTACYTILSKR